MLTDHPFTSDIGDSYSSVDYHGPNSPHPTPQEPLGVPFPGHTWASINSDDPNWVGHIVNMVLDERRDFLVFDYAIGGDRVENLEYQVNRGFQTIRDRPNWAPWTAEDSLFGQSSHLTYLHKSLIYLLPCSHMDRNQRLRVC